MKGELDDGRGSARRCIFRHQHEADTGRTSCIATTYIGFKPDGNQIFSKRLHNRQVSWAEIASQSNKRIQLIDLAGHEKYLKTTVFGLTGMQPDFAVVVIGANMGVKRMTKEHLGIAIALDIPVLIALTKIDLAPKNVARETLKTVRTYLKKAGKMPMMVKELAEASLAAKNIQSNRIAPIFPLSNVTGDGLDNLRCFMRQVVPREDPSSVTEEINQTDVEENDSFAMPVDDTFQVPGVGFVVAGSVHQGQARPNETLSLGPDHSGHFHTVTVRSIESMHVPIKSARKGHHVSLAIRATNKKVPVNRSMFRKGMVLLNPSIDIAQHVSRTFEARVVILHHQTTIAKGYAPVINCHTIRQTAQILSIKGPDGSSTIRTGDRALVRFRFLQYAEYIPVKARFVFRDGQAKGIGKIIRVVVDEAEEGPTSE